jgi:nicotinate-nucleotide adenylyltransferase
MGGTFDPIHYAHLFIAEEARERFGLDKVLFVPAGQPPHKTNHPVSDAEHRYAMTLLSTASNPFFEVSRIEIDRSGPSYSVDTIRTLKAEHGQDIEIYFIVGSDEALDLPNWHEAESLPQLVRFIAVPRPGFRLDDLETKLPAPLFSVVDLLPLTPMDISSTEIRARVAVGKSIRYMVTEGVEAYIYKHNLYVRG